MSKLEYSPLPPPQDVNYLGQYLQNELIRIGQAISVVSDKTGIQLVRTSLPVSTSVGVGEQQPVNQFDTISYENEFQFDQPTGNITALSAATVEYTFIASVTADANNTTINFDVFVNNVLIPSGGGSVFIKTSGEYAPISFSGFGAATRGDIVVFKVSHDSGASRNITYNNLRAIVRGSLV